MKTSSTSLPRRAVSSCEPGTSAKRSSPISFASSARSRSSLAHRGHVVGGQLRLGRGRHRLAGPTRTPRRRSPPRPARARARRGRPARGAGGRRERCARAAYGTSVSTPTSSSTARTTTRMVVDVPDRSHAGAHPRVEVRRVAERVEGPAEARPRTPMSSSLSTVSSAERPARRPRPPSGRPATGEPATRPTSTRPSTGIRAKAAGSERPDVVGRHQRDPDDQHREHARSARPPPGRAGSGSPAAPEPQTSRPNDSASRARATQQAPTATGWGSSPPPRPSARCPG